MAPADLHAGIRDVSAAPIEAVPRTLADLTERLPYRPLRDELARITRHCGQRKLLLTEIDFFARDVLRYGADVPRTVVYAGSSPGDHIPFLQQLFPTFGRFLLYDPAPCRVEGRPGIENHQVYFTDEVATDLRDVEKIPKDHRVLFICDIRTGTATCEDVVANMEWQQRWCEQLYPDVALLKFRAPYDSDEPVVYLAGDAYIQPWPPQSSTELRLEVTPPFAKTVYSPRDIEEKLFYYNNVLREWGWCALPDVPGLDHSADAAQEMGVWDTYLACMARSDLSLEWLVAHATGYACITRHAHGDAEPHLPMLAKRPRLRALIDAVQKAKTARRERMSKKDKY
jgi:hypothetical protein